MDNVKEYKGKTITESEYYYGCTPDTWDSMSYWDAVKDRHERAKKIYNELLQEQFKDITKKKTYEDQVREHKVHKALQDTKRLLDERNNLEG